MKLLNPVLLSIGLATLGSALLGAAPAFAGGYAGVLLGPSFVNNGLGTQFVYGGHVGAVLSPYFGLGFYGTNESLGSGSASNGSISVSSGGSETVLAAEANAYPLGSNIFSLGAKIGIGITSASETISGGGISANGSGSETDLAIGPAAGVNFPIAPNWTAGGEVNAIFVTTSGSTLDLINVMGGVSYWF